MDKTAVRAKILAERRASAASVPSDGPAQALGIQLQRLREMEPLQRAPSAITLGVFRATPTELSLEPWIADLPEENRLALPVPTDLQAWRESSWRWVVLSVEQWRRKPWVELAPGWWFPECALNPPAETVGPLDWVLVPGLAFTSGGRRLGRGYGHYDRLLAEESAQRAVRIGVVGDDSVDVYDWPEDPWDIRMHRIVTPTRIVFCN